MTAGFFMASVLTATIVDLPAPVFRDPVSIAEALKARRSVREFDRAAINIRDVAQLLWAAQGITTGDGRRTAPSAGALYPLEIYLVAGNVASLRPAVYHYQPLSHSLEIIMEGDRRAALAHAALGQESIAEAAAVLVIAAEVRRTASKYATRAERYVDIEAGCAAQNVALEAVARNLGTVIVGAFDDTSVSRTLTLQRSHAPLILMPIGYPRKGIERGH